MANAPMLAEFLMKLTIDNDDNHPLQELGQFVRVSAGLHPVRIEFFDATGEAELTLDVQEQGGERKALPAGWFFRD